MDKAPQPGMLEMSYVYGQDVHLPFGFSFTSLKRMFSLQRTATVAFTHLMTLSQIAKNPSDIVFVSTK